MPARPEDRSVNFNYVIPGSVRSHLERYCDQNLISPSRLVRRLILEYVEGDRVLEEHPVHPEGKRTSVTLPERLLNAFEEKIEADGHSTKAAVIAALLGQFLPGRVLAPDTETVRVEADLPADIFSTIYGSYGPGPINEVLVKALTSLANQSKLTKESV
jgi:hypothetical protein